MQGDVAAVIYVGERESGGIGHRHENFFGYCACYRGHGRDEVASGEGSDGVGHALRDWALRARAIWARGGTQERKFAAEFVENGDESLCCGAIRGFDFCG